jgi:hypothetical protein
MLKLYWLKFKHLFAYLQVKNIVLVIEEQEEIEEKEEVVEYQPNVCNSRKCKLVVQMLEEDVECRRGFVLVLFSKD